MARPPPDPYFVLRSHAGAVTCLCFVEEEQLQTSQNPVPSHAMNPHLLSGSDIGEIFLWNLKVNRVVCRLPQQDEKVILWLNYFQGKILSQIKEIGIKIWTYVDDSWAVSGTIPMGKTGFCSSAMLNSSVSTHLITSGQKTSCVSVLDFETKKVTTVFEPPEASHGMCMCLNAFTLNEKLYVLCGYEDGTVILWDCQSCSIVSSLSCHKEPVMCLDFDKNYNCSGISGSADDYLLVWKLDECKLLIKEKIKLTNPGVASVAIRDDGKIVVVGCWDSRVRVFSWKTLKPLAVLHFHSGTINCIKFSLGAVGKYKTVFAAGSKDKNISLWSLY